MIELDSSPLPDLADAVRAHSESLATACMTTIRNDITEYHSEFAARPELESDVREAVLANLFTFAGILEGKYPEERRLANEQFTLRRIEQGIPVELVLRALSSATLTVWSWLVDEGWLHRDQGEVVSKAWPVWLAWMNESATQASRIYHEHELQRVVEQAAARAGLLNDLLDRHVSGPSARRALERLGIEPDAPLIIVASRIASADASEFDGLSSVARAISGAVSALTGSHPVVTLRSGVSILLADARVFTADDVRTAIRTGLSSPTLHNVATNTAVSAIFETADRVADVSAATRKSLEVASEHTAPFLVSEIGLLDYIAAALGSDIRFVCPPRVREFVRTEGRERDDWLATIEAWIANNTNVKQTAAALHVHVNTVYYRLAQIERLCGINPSNVQECLALLFAGRLRDFL